MDGLKNTVEKILQNLSDKISLIMPQFKLLYVPYKISMPLFGVMVHLPQPLWSQEKRVTRHIKTSSNRASLENLHPEALQSQYTTCGL